MFAGLLYDYDHFNIFECIREDNLDLFLKSNESKNTKDRILSFILSHNTGKISQHVIQNIDIPITSLLQYVNKISTKSKNREIRIGLVFKIFLYNTYKTDDYGKIINKATRNSNWEIVDYLHILGYKAYDQQKLFDDFPDNRFRSLEHYGYDLTEHRIICRIREHKDVDISKLNTDMITKLRPHILSCFKYDALKKLHENKLIEFYTDDIDIICSNLNVSGLMYLFDCDYKITDKMINLLFGNKQLPDNYENDMMKLIDMLTSISCVFRIKRQAWISLLKNKCFNLVNKLFELGFRPKIDSYDTNKLLYNAINEDDVVSLKKYLEFGLFKADKLSNKSDILDTAIFSNSDKISKFFINELKMKCSKSILTNYIRRHRRNFKIKFIDLIKVLESLEFPIKRNVLTFASRKADKQVIEYLIEKKGLKPNSQDIESLLFNRNYELTSYLIEKGAKINRINLIDRLIAYNINKSRRHTNLNMYNMIKYVHKNYNATASQKAINCCFIIKSLNVFRFLVDELKLTCEHIVNINDNLFNRYCTRRTNDNVTFTKYVLDNADKLKITLDDNIKSAIIYNAISYRNSDGLLDYLVSKFNYKLNVHDMHAILENFNTKGLEIMMKQGIEITSELVDELIVCSNKIFMQILHKEYNIDVMKFITLKQIHNHISLYHLYGQMIEYLCDCGLKITPYTLELFVKTQPNLLRANTIIFMINKLDNKITQKSKDNIMQLYNAWANRHWHHRRYRAKRNNDYHKELINVTKECKIIEYKPDPNEVVNIHIQAEQIVDYSDSDSDGHSHDDHDHDDDIFDIKYDANRYIVVGGQQDPLGLLDLPFDN